MIKDFRTSYRVHPIGLDENPRFSWKLSGDRENLMQKAYRLQVWEEAQRVWDTGRVEEDRSILIPYEGMALKPSASYRVQLEIWDSEGRHAEQEGMFETGLMGEAHPESEWITHTLSEEEKASPIFEKSFGLEKEPIKKARLYITAAGIYEAYLNGKKVGEDFFAPGWTSYTHRLQYQTYDITPYLEQENCLEVMLGNGWYKGYLGFNETPNHYGDRTALRALVLLEYQNGTREVVGTDTSWKVRTQAVRDAEFYYGETQDLTLEAQPAGGAVLFPKDCINKVGELVSQETEPVRITKRFSVKEKFVTPKGELVLDFGQNMAGFVEVRLPALEGKQLVVRHAETLDKEGNFYTENLRSAISVDTYIYGALEVGKVVRPHFTFHGFRYIALEGVPADVDPSCFTACALHSDMDTTGCFTTDNVLVNQLQSNITWGQRGNFIDVPTDCPQRNERLGWTGDAQVFCKTAGFNYNTALFFQKWMRDVAAETTLEFGVPHVVPNILGDQAGTAAWSDCVTIIPWTQFQIYGDVKFLEEAYPAMIKWVEYIRSHCSENGLWQTGFQYGDWLALDIEKDSSDRTGGTDKYLVANAYYAYSTEILYKTAEILGEQENADRYKALYEQILEAYRKEFITATGRLVSETQTACVLMLYFRLAQDQFRDRIIGTLEANLGNHRNHLTTGFVGTPYICHCLSEIGKHDLAEGIFLKEDYPGWFYAIKKGATTVWERWNSILPNGDFDESGMNSLNHYAYGSIGDWMYRKIAGIQPAAPGYKKILIHPLLTRGMTEVSAEYESVYGTIKSAWTCKNGKITVDVEIPANTTAELILPEKEERMALGSGCYHFEYETETHLEIQRFSMDSTLGSILAEKVGVEMFNQLMPGMLDNPMIKYAYELTLNEILAQAPAAKPLYEAVLKALNAEDNLKKE